MKPKSSLSQNFIFDTKVTDRIVSYAGDLTSFDVIEIGPGLGSLTSSILKCSPRRLVSIEKDERFFCVHKKLSESSKCTYQTIFSDALKVDFLTLCSSPVKVIANLPYNISTPLLFKLLDYKHIFTSLTLMFQKEVADRIVAQSGNKAYGKLSIITQLMCNVEKMEDFEPKIFSPAPKVSSSVINVYPLTSNRFEVDLLKLKKILDCTFNGRRKMLSTTLKSFVKYDIDSFFSALGIRGTMRPENLTIEDFCRIANAIKSI